MLFKFMVQIGETRTCLRSLESFATGPLSIRRLRSDPQRIVRQMKGSSDVVGL